MESSLGIISWIIFGALAGWVASMIAGTNREQGLRIGPGLSAVVLLFILRLIRRA